MELVEISRSPTRAAAEQQALVLAAVGISSRLVGGDGGVVALYVSSVDALRADWELHCYARENAAPRRPRLPAVAALYRIEGALAYCAMLLFFFAAERRHAFSIDWLAAGAANSLLTINGSGCRPNKELSQHPEIDHQLGKLAVGALAGVLVAQLRGAGVGWLALLLVGALRNEVNALLHGSALGAIGACTEVFGAVGIRSGLAGSARSVPWL
jgi:hypothetical protein